MTLLSPRLYQSLNATLFIAYHGTEATPISGARLSKHFGVSNRAFEPVLQLLGKADILQSVRGQFGGYYVERPESITLRDIFSCFLEDLLPNGKGEEFSYIIQSALLKSHEKFLQELSGITLKDLCNDLGNAGIPTSLTEILDFNI